MKFMKLGTRPDTFYTEEATRSVISDVPSDFVVHINNISYLLHKFPLLPKCGLLQRLCSDSDDSSTVSIELHDLPGGEEAFELCAKYCYGITIDLSAHNFVPAFCAAKFLRMTESIEKGNFVLKLEYFLNSCILEGWKDSITTLQTTAKLTEWSENLGIIRKCIDSIAQKILTAPERPGYKKTRESIPRDWWTEDISDLDIDLFRFIITAIRSTYMLPPQLIGEALHVYACRWLPDTKRIKPHESSVSQNDDDVTEKNRRILESIVSMIPEDRGSVSAGFLLRLLGIANYLGASPVLKTELIRKSSLQIEEATVSDLVFPSQSSSSQHLYDTDLVLSVVESFLILWRRQPPETVENTRLIRAIRKVGKLIDTYLQVVSRDKNMPVSKVVSLAEALPDIARKDHDDLYKAINIYLKEHPDLGKEDKKRLCRSLDCQKLSREVRAHAVKNERLPLRTVVQVLFFEQEKGSRATDSRMLPRELFSRGKQMQISGEELNKLHLGGDEQSVRMEEMRRTPMPNLNKLHLGGDEQSVRLEEMRRTAMPESSTRDFPKNKRPDKNSQLESEIEEVESKWEKDAREEGISGSKLDPKKILQSRIRLDHGPDKVRDR
ncbi:hypothetical protein GH714_011526 [Hevea brasiliensis]|uniref:NPH3 domain-containing protein n=1 Tax=Hevea brasiliensis TaxID=3981 RepID=A0A6A6M0P7_HEVBR|nr:hypothetical protein GH714_011526 [Hevea brasiliensis]